LVCRSSRVFSITFVARLLDNVRGHEHAVLGKDRVDGVVNVINAAILEVLLRIVLILTDSLDLGKDVGHLAKNQR